jgi:mRNA-degrading endonuclease RelE of RelBE toxin-antitoxin system
VNFRLNRQVEKDLKKISDKNLLIQFKKLLQELKRVPSIHELTGIKKMKGERNYYRYRVGDYRVGFKIEDNEVLILKVAHRKEIYRNFP